MRTSNDQRADTEATDEDATDVVEIPLTFLDNDEALKCVKNQYSQDSFFIRILDSPEPYRNSEVKDRYVLVKTKGKRAICIQILAIEGRTARERPISQAHLGAAKTLAYLHGGKKLFAIPRAFATPVKRISGVNLPIRNHTDC